MKNIAAISTHYGPYRLRSRVEARWCCFFDAAGIRFRYEWEGFGLPSGGYLPDFWLPELRMFFEVKGTDPTDAEIQKCEELVEASGFDMLLAPGPPEERAELILFLHGSGQQRGRYVFARDKITELGFWLVALPDDIESRWLGPAKVMDCVRGGPMFSGALAEAYTAAASARFERGDGKKRFAEIAEPDPDRHWREDAA